MEVQDDKKAIYAAENQSVILNDESFSVVHPNGNVSTSFQNYKIEPMTIIYEKDPSEVEKYFTKHLLILEYVSIAITIVCFVVSAIYAFEDNSVSALAFAVDAFMDVLSYLIVIWRFWQSSSKKQNMDALMHKERVALICLALLFIGSSVGVEYESAHNFIKKLKPETSVSLIAVGILQSIAFSALSSAKFYLAIKMNKNKTVISDGINSFVASISSLSMSISMLIFFIDSRVWYLDAIFGFIMGAIVFLYGLKLLVSNTILYKR